MFHQEGDSSVWADVDVIVNLEQFWKEYPDINCLYLEPSFYAVSSQMALNVNRILDVCIPPTKLYKVDVLSKRVVSMSPDVS